MAIRKVAFWNVHFGCHLQIFRGILSEKQTTKAEFQLHTIGSTTTIVRLMCHRITFYWMPSWNCDIRLGSYFERDNESLLLTSVIYREIIVTHRVRCRAGKNTTKDGNFSYGNELHLVVGKQRKVSSHVFHFSVRTEIGIYPEIRILRLNITWCFRWAILATSWLIRHNLGRASQSFERTLQFRTTLDVQPGANKNTWQGFSVVP